MIKIHFQVMLYASAWRVAEMITHGLCWLHENSLLQIGSDDRTNIVHYCLPFLWQGLTCLHQNANVGISLKLWKEGVLYPGMKVLYRFVIPRYLEDICVLKWF